MSGRSSNKSDGDPSVRNDLHKLFDKRQVNDDDPSSWEVIRDWLDSHSTLEAYDAASYRGRDGTTALHIACRSYAPPDIIKSLIEINSSACEWEDDFGWLPLHYACHHGISEDAVQMLISNNPNGVKVIDAKGRNPLHFAVGNVGKKNGLFNSSIFTSLVKNGSVNVADKKGMMPIHYACAYGASQNTLKVLIDAHPKALSVTDTNGFLPLHYAFGNCEREDCPAIVELLLKRDPEVVNLSFDHKNHPLYILSNRANKLKDNSLEEQGKENAIQSMILFLDVGPMPTTNFFTALHTMPKWMLDKAVVHPRVQELLNYRISNRFPTAVMMLDFYAICTILISFGFLVIESIDIRADSTSEDDGLKSSKLTPLYLCAVYFALRELIQVLSFIHLGLFSVWFRRGTNWLELSSIVLILAVCVVLNTGAMELGTFRTWAAFSAFFFWLNFLNFLRGLLVDFAVFVSGVLHVVQRLGPFLLALLIILIAFMQMFFTVFQQTGYCDGYDNEKTFVDSCDPENAEPYRFCSNWRTFLGVITMLLGEVDEADFETSHFATLLFVVFVFLVVILLATVLIAIVTDFYTVIRNERAAIVFWGGRLDFIVETDVISNGVFKNLNLGPLDDNDGEKISNASKISPSTLWKSIVDVFDTDLNRIEVWSVDFLCLTLVRFAIIFILIPTWIVLGFFTAGCAWPAQWRKRILEQKISSQSKSSSAKEEQQMHELKELKEIVDDLRAEVAAEVAANQELLSQLKSEAESLNLELTNDFKEIRSVMSTLFEVQRKRVH